MAITTVNPRYEGFIFDGENSRDYGIYVQSVKVFGAPTRDVEMVSIPGRDGEFVLDKGRFNNIQVVYTCALGTDTQTDFNTGVSDFRNWLASRKGYKRLEDEINTDEYRMAVFKDGLDVSTLNKETGTFEVTFDCKPQRFLKSGEIPRNIGGSVTNTQTESGAVVSLESDGGDAVTSLVAQIEPVQAGSGDPSPTNVRPITGWTAANVTVSGKNLIAVTARTQTNNGVTFTFNDDGSVLVSAPSAVSNFAELNFKYSAGVRYLPVGVPLTVSGGKEEVVVRACYNNGSGTKFAGTSDGSDVTFTIPDNAGTTWARVRVQPGFQGEALIYPMVRLASDTDATWEAINGNTYPVSFGSAGTVYGGTVDVVTGVLTVTHKMIDMGAYKWNYYSAQDIFYHTFADKAKGVMNCFSDIYATKNIGTLSDFQMRGESNNGQIIFKDSRFEKTSGTKSALSGHTCVYELATPQTYNLTAQQVELLTGQNNAWADTGDISITYGHDPNKLVNPTLFESHPLLKVNGYGTIAINGEEIALRNEPIGRVQLGGGGSYKNSLTYHFDEIPFNSGDIITVPDYRHSYQFDMVKPYGSGQLIRFGPIYSESPWLEYIFENRGHQGVLTVLTDTSTFRVGTEETAEYTVIGAVEYDDRDGTRQTKRVTVTTGVYYNGAGTIRFTASVVSVEGSDITVKSLAGNAPNFYGTSSKLPISGTVYYDLDIGEAYIIEDGKVIGVNNVAEIPAVLPTLKPAHNTVTFDNTITKLVILPRWWKV